MIQDTIETISARKLLDMKLPPTRFVVQGLLPQGLHVFAGPPKIGKSWLLLQLALAVASGKPLWGLETEQGSVLSLCLEDSRSRLQQRLSSLTDDPPEQLYLATLSHTLSDGLCEQLEDFLQEHDDTNLIIIDTLQMIRGGGSGDSNQYASDYQDVSRLKSIADEHDIAIVLVHHLRKRAADDPHVTISGTTGLVGAADGSYVLRREHIGDRELKLYVRGRDVEESILTLARDEELNEWSLVSCDTAIGDALKKEPALLKLVEYLKTVTSFHGTASQLTETLGVEMQPNVLSRKLGKYRQELLNVGVSFHSSRTGQQRFLSLTYRDYDAMTIRYCGGTESSQSPKSVENTGELE